MNQHDMSRPAPTPPDVAFDYTLTVDHCAEQYALAGHARTARTIQRYCTNGALDARKVTTISGDKFLVTPHSLRRHIEELNQLAAQTASIGQGWTPFDIGGDRFRQRRTPSLDVARTEAAATPPVTPRHVAPITAPVEPSPTPEPAKATPATPSDPPRQDASARETPADHHLEGEVAFLRDQIAIKDQQLATKDRQLEAKDTQIAALLDRNREGNVLMQTMQQLLMLLPRPTERTDTPQSPA